jgi:hypothetical protein
MRIKSIFDPGEDLGEEVRRRLPVVFTKARGRGMRNPYEE